ncbi:MAG: Mu transposase C-terminal domain-containing protein [Terriglobia bacterium]
MDAKPQPAGAEGVWITVDDLAGALGVHRVTAHRLVREGQFVSRDRREIDGKRGTMVWLGSLPHEAQMRNFARARQRALAPVAEQALAPQTSRTSASQAQFTFAEMPEAIAMLPIPGAQKPLLWKRFTLIKDSENGVHRLAGISWTKHFECNAEQLGISKRSAYRIRAQYKAAIAEHGDTPEGRNKAILALLDDKRGPKPFGPERLEGWAIEFLRDLRWKRFSKRACLRALFEEIGKRQAAWGAQHIYPVPSTRAVMEALDSVSHGGMLEALAHGEKRFEDKFGCYLSRDYSRLQANDIWVTDQRLCNVRLRDGGESLGRIWVVNFLDVASRRWLGCAFAPVLSSDMVMSAAAMSLARYGAPRAVHEDRGKEFNCTAFNGSFRKLKGETLFKRVDGVWGSLNVRVVQAIGDNPKTKIIEAWHRNLDEFDKRFPGWCGSNTDERPERLADAERQHEAWTRGTVPATPLARIDRYIMAYLSFCEHEYNGRHEHGGKGMNGMTPEAAWNVKQPAGGVRKIDASGLETLMAEHRKLKVARGGQVNITLHGQLIEYEAPELFLRQGEEVEVLISRRTLAEVLVLDRDGRQICRAKAKPLYEWLPENRDELRAAMRCKAALHRAVKKGIAAREVLSLVANPMEIAQAPDAAREISSNEYWAARAAKGLRTFRPKKDDFERQARRLAERTTTSEEIASRAIASLAEEGA